jgi:hypothetical protein
MVYKIFYWLPRIVTILALLFMLMFSFDAFTGDASIGKKLLGFFMNSIPVILLASTLAIAWNYELTGGIIYIVLAFAGAIFFRSFKGNPWSLVVLIPFVINGLLFILNYYLNRKRTN